MYKLEIAPINENADGKFFNSWLRDNYIFNSVSYLELAVDVWFSSEPTPEVKAAIIEKYYSLKNTDIIAFSDLLKEFSKASTDGSQYFYEFASEHFSLKYESGELTIENINHIFNKLHNVIIKLTLGLWGIALYSMMAEMEAITQEDIDNGYTQELHDKIILDMQTYLTP